FDDVVVEIYIRPEGEYPGNIAAIVEPEELAPGDTASITFKRRYLNGTLEDFREWRTFEIGMLDGCTLGNLLVDGTLGQYFYDVAQPVYFVVDPSANTGTVKLQVGLVGIGTRPIKNNLTNDTDKQINTENPKQKLDLKEITSTRREIRTKPVEENKKIYENNPPNKPENSNCPLLDFIAPVPSNFEFNVGDECDDLNLCVGVPYPEFVQYKMITSGGNNPDVCTPNTIDPITGNIQFQSGGFTALDWRPDNSQRISAEPCFDNENNNVQFKMVLTDAETNQNSPILKPEAILEVCEDNITSAGVILINSTEQLLNIIRLFPEQIPIIKADMDSVLSRYNAGIIKYKFRQEILVHESEHKKDYESYLASLKTDLLDGKVMDYSLTCEQFNLDPYATDYAKIEYLRIVKEYIKESNRIAGIEIDELKLHQRPSVQASLADYYILLYNYENRIIF
ncbi:MAG TPA: hypothetical protein VLH59_14020, partial [Ignavibacteriaceae bacterium]|nr:hypothetical protein [Ignavibacteriaceae bacterium]